MDELDYLSCGMVWDLLTEQANDSCDYPKIGAQAARAVAKGEAD